MSRIRPTALVPALAFVMLSGVSTAAFAAGEINEDALAADRKACGQTCTSKGQSSAFCEAYCDCTVKAVGEQLSLDEYRDLSDAAAKQEPAPASTVTKLKTITNACRTEMGKAPE